MFSRFWDWYNRYYVLNVGFAAFLFLLQVIHLIWLTGEVVYGRLFGDPLFSLAGIWLWIIIFVDYLEIPAIISVSLVYINDLRRGFRWRPLTFLLLLNSQWLHILWITDEFVIRAFAGNGIGFALWLAWIAILIDYLEIPVIIETFRKFFEAVRKKNKDLFKKAFKDR